MKVEVRTDLSSQIPTVTVDQMREVDRLMVEGVGIELIQMMENAGRCLAQHVRSELGGSVRGRRITVLAGAGGNGGGGLVAARRLSIWGAEVTVALGQNVEAMHGVPRHQLAILQRIGIPIKATAAAIEADLLQSDQLIDALIGYSLRGKPSGPIANLITAANSSGRPIAALDIPSGLPGDTGMATDPTIRATTTLTLALPKVGLLRPEARPFVGRLYLADISVPQPVYDLLGISVGTIFGESDIVRVMSAG
ncbi:MAG TPA: NAD(P)H-hydrate epimerase [Candidatus Acidoferrum sp.]|nr:NAD(P)H-hydrate epimerase [Candidatus Acidoferrum sp.]